MDVTTIRHQAVQRVLLRRRPATERVQHGHITDLTIREVVGSEFLPPETLSEWIDDQLAARAQPRGPFIPVLVAILEGARVSDTTAAGAIAAARRLSAWDAWHLYCDLEQMRAGAMLPDAKRLMSALTARWESTRGLPDAQPGYPKAGELDDPPEPETLTYPTKFGIPAGRLPWAS